MSMLRRHERARCLAALIPIVLLGLVAAPASADPAKARAHFDLGKRYFEVDEYVKAIEEFKAAHVEEPDPAFLYNIAECYRHMGDNKDALVFYRRFLLLSPANSPTRPSVEKRVAALQAATRDAADGPPVPTAVPCAAPAPLGAPAPAPKLSPAPPASAAPREQAPAPAPATLALAAPPTTTAPPAVELREQTSAAPTSDDSRPFYKKPWFYIVVGGALVAGTVGAFALAAGKAGSPPSTPLGNQPAFR